MVSPVRMSPEICSRSLSAPTDWDDRENPCGTLDIMDLEFAGKPFMISQWRPTTEEIEILNAGGYIRLWIGGASHPVVAFTFDERML